MFSKENRVKSKEQRGVRVRVFFFLLSSLLFTLYSSAQCAMCRAALTSEGNTTKAQAVNDGIVYLMAIPYLLVGILAYIVYRMFKKKA